MSKLWTSEELRGMPPELIDDLRRAGLIEGVGGDGTADQSARGTIAYGSAEWVKQASPEQIVEALESGALDDYLKS